MPQGESKGGTQGGTLLLGGLWAWTHPWPRQEGAREGVGPLRLSFGLLEPPVTLIFYIFYWNFWATVNMGINLQFTNISRQKLALGALS